MPYSAFGAHKHYTVASVAELDGHLVREERIEHERGVSRPVRARVIYFARDAPDGSIWIESVKWIYCFARRRALFRPERGRRADEPPAGGPIREPTDGRE